MVRTSVCVSAVLALIATVSAGPLIRLKTKDIGPDRIIVKDSGNRLIRADDAHVHVVGGHRHWKREEAGETPIRISKAVGVKGNKKMAKLNANKGTAPKQ